MPRKPRERPKTRQEIERELVKQADNLLTGERVASLKELIQRSSKRSLLELTGQPTEASDGKVTEPSGETSKPLAAPTSEPTTTAATSTTTSATTSTTAPPQVSPIATTALPSSEPAALSSARSSASTKAKNSPRNSEKTIVPPLAIPDASASSPMGSHSSRSQKKSPQITLGAAESSQTPQPSQPAQSIMSKHVARNGLEIVAQYAPRPPTPISKDKMLTQPKVMVPYVTPPGFTPRKVAIERKRRLFDSLDIESLLNECGLLEEFNLPVLSEHTGIMSLLPLYLFDDFEFETRTYDEWLTLRYKEGDVEHGVPARAIKHDDAGIAKWLPCEVLDYDASQFLWKIRFVPTTASQTSTPTSDNCFMVPRIHLLFQAEDPEIFVSRVEFAVSQRKQAESFLRYSCYLDGMPIDDTTPILKKQANSILSLVLSPKRFQPLRTQARHLFKEVAKEYGHSMNKVVLDTLLSSPGMKDFVESLQLDENTSSPFTLLPQNIWYFFSSFFPPHLSSFSIVFKKQTQRDRCEMESDGWQSYETATSDFLFHTLFTRPEIISALIKVNQECLSLMSPQNVLFNTRITKSIRLEEFEQMQLQNLNTVVQTYVKDRFVLSISISHNSSLKFIVGLLSSKMQSQLL